MKKYQRIFWIFICILVIIFLSSMILKNFFQIVFFKYTLKTSHQRFFFGFTSKIILLMLTFLAMPVKEIFKPSNQFFVCLFNNNHCYFMKVLTLPEHPTRKWKNLKKLAVGVFLFNVLWFTKINANPSQYSKNLPATWRTWNERRREFEGICL